MQPDDWRDIRDELFNPGTWLDLAIAFLLPGAIVAWIAGIFG